MFLLETTFPTLAGRRRCGSQRWKGSAKPVQSVGYGLDPKRRVWKRENLGESASFIPSANTLENVLPTTRLEMIQKWLMISVFLLMFFFKSIFRIHWPGHNVLIPNGFNHFAFFGGCGKWKTLGTLWRTLLLAFSRLKRLEPNRPCFLNNSEIMWCNLQMSELRTERYHLFQIKRDRIKGFWLRFATVISIFTLKSWTGLLWVSKQKLSFS